MTYSEAIDYLFTATPVFQHVGSSAYKPGLDTTHTLDVHYGHPHRFYRTIHVGGTNGKGSTSHTLAAILQQAGYRVGLFTSPHLIDFRERIRVNGEMISPEAVIDFVVSARQQVEALHPSFFELTTMMALRYFADAKVDVAIIEVGLGGRLDSTNIITPDLSIITNISFDHTQYLGNTLADIAYEKAGIIKPNVPVVIGRADEPSVRMVFEAQAQRLCAPIYFAQEADEIIAISGTTYTTKSWGDFTTELRGLSQTENTATILTALGLLIDTFDLDPEAVRYGFAHVTSLTGLLGRWMTLKESPKIICDTGHNVAGIAQIVTQIKQMQESYRAIRIVLGMASDKDVRSVLQLFPTEWTYYFTEASVPRALPVDTLVALASGLGIEGSAHPSVGEALEQAMADADTSDCIFVGGSTFVIADLLTHWNKKTKQ